MLLHTVGITGILTEALLSQQQEPPFEAETISGANLDIVMIDPNRENPFKEDEPEPALNMDTLCGDWKGGRRKPDLQIFKAAPGYMIALGKKPKNGEVGDCYLIHELRGNACFNAGDGVVVLSYDKERDTITLYPGGEYTRIEETKK